jgi:hypothetical protein
MQTHNIHSSYKCFTTATNNTIHISETGPVPILRQKGGEAVRKSCHYLPALLSDPEDGSSMFFQNYF